MRRISLSMALALSLAAQLIALQGQGLARAQTRELATKGVIDELCLTLSPTLVGGDASRILDGAVLGSILNADLVHVLESEGFLFLRYAIGSAPR